MFFAVNPNKDYSKKQKEKTKIPYPGFPDAECPKCGASKKEPHKRWPYCSLCNP
jgi:hypothetical protein